jgi:UPF0755 protein
MKINPIKLIISLTAALLIAGLIAFGAAALIARELNKPPAGSAGALAFTVSPGESPRSVGRRLEEAGAIKSSLFWNVVVNRVDTDFLKSGAYTLRLPATQFEIHNMLETGQQKTVKVTIPEGRTLSKTAKILEDALVCPAEDFLAAASSPALLKKYGIPGNTMEGYLFPDTYFFQENVSAEKAVGILADNFFKRLSSVADTSALSPDALFEKVILASIVEREYRVADEAPVMAGVFYNRLAVNMPLQSCATVEYVITEIQGKPHPKILYTRDTEIKDPYNTYVHRGLPPAPICSPGLTALSAVFFPASSDYLYFRLTNTDTGAHYFSKTFDDHIKAGALYLKNF